ncbi:SRPBCC family protein [Cryptosporangium minutisporangium]|uniref:SRPBCC family protein n=1 Tax=Cryptosporangium minutisporangium TaxID=113569 RepID=A0ABP6ST93_9ACTN
MSTSAPLPLQDGETITASTVVRRAPEEVYALVTDVTRIPEWSPECVRCEWLDEHRFKGWNRRALARWSTVATVVNREPDREFSFVVRLGWREFTEWTYRTDPGPEPDTTQLTETFRMRMPLPRAVLWYERLMLRVRDRRTDLQQNLEQSLERIRALAENQ